MPQVRLQFRRKAEDHAGHLPRADPCRLLSVLRQRRGVNPVHRAEAIHLWRRRVHGVDRADWLPYLVDHRAGRTVTAECDPRAWEALKADYLRLERRTFEDCYRTLERIATKEGWGIPSSITLHRRMDREIPVPVQVLVARRL